MTSSEDPQGFSFSFIGGLMDTPKDLLPFTIDELLAHTFLPHDGRVAYSEDDNALMAMTPQGDLVVIPAPTGQVFSDMSPDEFDRFAEIWTQSIHGI